MPDPKNTTRMVRWVFAGVTAVLLAVVLFLMLKSEPNADDSAEGELPADWMQRPQAKLVDGYAGSDACRSCHAHNHETWYASYHRTMTQVPDAENVQADFADVTLELDGQSWILSRTGDKYWVELDDPEWTFAMAPRRVKRQIVLITGSHHEQDFWFETPRGRAVQRLPFVYRIEEQEWYPDVSVLMTPPDSPAGFGEWNMVCIQCHTTLGRPRVDLETGYARSEVVEFGISCEACHGPGEAHVKRYQPGSGESDGDTDWASLDQIVNPSELDHRRSAETCGQCHGVTAIESANFTEWVDHGFRFRPGNNLAESRKVVQPDMVGQDPDLSDLVQANPMFLDSRFWSDGMVRVVGREYNGLVKSPCYLRGELSCLSCHQMHPEKDDPRPLKDWANDQLKPGMDSNRACLQCHESIGEQLAEHTHHPAESVGSRCYNCHMPPTTYGLLKAVHSHQIDSPNLTGSLSAGRPNACNLCHLDKSMGWANDHLADWYGIEKKTLTELQEGVPASIIWGLRGDAGQRALVAWAMNWPPAREASGTDWQGRILATLLNDPYDVVRFIARRSLQSLSGFEEFEYDFLAPPDVRRSQSESALARWETMRQQADQSVDLIELFHVPPDQPALEILNELLRNRDDRVMELAE